MTPRRWLFGGAVLGALILHSRVVLVVFLAIAWMVCAWFWPFAPCFRCQGRKTNKGSTKKRFGMCKLCRGTGSRQVLGSKALHRTVRAGVKFRNERREK